MHQPGSSIQMGDGPPIYRLQRETGFSGFREFGISGFQNHGFPGIRDSGYLDFSNKAINSHSSQLVMKHKNMNLHNLYIVDYLKYRKILENNIVLLNLTLKSLLIPTFNPKTTIRRT